MAARVRKWRGFEAMDVGRGLMIPTRGLMILQGADQRVSIEREARI